MDQCLAPGCIGFSSYGSFLQVRASTSEAKRSKFFLDANKTLKIYAPLTRHASFNSWQNLISGWDELECNRVFNYLCDTTNLPKKVQLVTAGKPGAFQTSGSRVLKTKSVFFLLTFFFTGWSHRQEQSGSRSSRFDSTAATFC